MQENPLDLIPEDERNRKERPNVGKNVEVS